MGLEVVILNFTNSVPFGTSSPHLTLIHADNSSLGKICPYLDQDCIGVQNLKDLPFEVFASTKTSVLFINDSNSESIFGWGLRGKSPFNAKQTAASSPTTFAGFFGSNTISLLVSSMGLSVRITSLVFSPIKKLKNSVSSFPHPHKITLISANRNICFIINVINQRARFFARRYGVIC